MNGSRALGYGGMPPAGPRRPELRMGVCQEAEEVEEADGEEADGEEEADDERRVEHRNVGG